jgi:HEAT repeat protein
MIASEKLVYKKRALSPLFFMIALISCNSVSEKDIPRLKQELASSKSELRNQAALSLARLGPKASPATKELIILLHDPNRGIRSSAAFALRKIESDEATKALDDYNKEK